MVSFLLSGYTAAYSTSSTSTLVTLHAVSARAGALWGKCWRRPWPNLHHYLDFTWYAPPALAQFRLEFTFGSQ